MPAESSKSKLWWFAGLWLRLLAVSIMGLFLAVFIVVSLGVLRLGSPVLFWTLMAMGLTAGYTWAIHFQFPFFQSLTHRQRLFISAGIAVPTVFVACWCAVALMSAAWDYATTSDQRIETAALPSGEILENHTHSESGFPDGVRVNELFLKNPATGASERIDSYRNLDYEWNDSLLVRFPHPQEFIYGDEKVLVIGSYLCQRIKFGNAPTWSITSIDFPPEAQAYLKSFFTTNDILSKSPSFVGLQGSMVPFAFDSLDLTNNILTLKKQMPEGYGGWQEFRRHPDSAFWDEFPPFLVYSATGLNGGSIYQFPFKFDLARTKAKNGPLWDNSAPTDGSSITIHSAKFGAKKKIEDVTARVIGLLQANADGFIVNTSTLGCDPFPRVKKHLTIEYGFKGFDFAATHANGDKVSYQTLINGTRK